jgi:hypothetical protein
MRTPEQIDVIEASTEPESNSIQTPKLSATEVKN